MGTAIVFDDGKGRLGPLTDLRASFEIRTGARTTLERWRSALPALRGDEVREMVVPEALAPLVCERHGPVVHTPASLPTQGNEPVMLINGRWLLPDARVRTLAPGQALQSAAHAGEPPTVLAACLDRQAARRFLAQDELPQGVRSESLSEAAFLHRPWDVVRWRDRTIDHDLQSLAARGGWSRAPEPVAINADRTFLAAGAQVVAGAVLDAALGPIVIDEGATIRPGAVVVGPVYVGPKSVVSERALIKAHTAIGPQCKVGGEVSGTIFQGFSNKVHDGFLGDAFIGEWVNLGALTTNSNLLNTYAEVRAQADPAAPREATGLAFLGCIVGDHVKTAIMTRIMTGAVIGTGAMVATTAPAAGAVPRFAWLTDSGRDVSRLEEVFETMRVVMKRRGMEPGIALIDRLRRLHQATSQEGASA